MYPKEMTKKNRYQEQWRVNMVQRILVLIVLLPILVAAQTDQKKDIWEPLKFLEGTWKGEDPGLSKVSQVYKFVLNGKFLHMKTRSVFEPTEKNPKGEVHEDFGIFSYDQGRKTFVMRGFYVEGFVNTSRMPLKGQRPNWSSRL
jgi:hypothetical protein